MRTRTWVIATLATLLLAGASVAALAATGAGPSDGASCAAPSSLPGQRVQVVLADMGGGPMMGGRMMLAASPPTVAAGTISFVAVDQGSRLHELLVLPLTAGSSVGTRAIGGNDTVDERTSLGEASRGCGAGHGDGIAPGQAGWVTLALRPGRYELLCNEPGHYAAGMFTQLDVT